MRKHWMIRLSTLAIWLLAAATAVYWVLKFVPSPTAPANAAVVGGLTTLQPDSSALARGLGGGLVAVTAAANSAPVVSTIDAARFVLTGIVTGQGKQQNLALIAMDGKPARPYKVGAELTDGVVLVSVNRYEAGLGTSADAAPGATLQLPRLFASAGGANQPSFNPSSGQMVPAPNVPQYIPPPTPMDVAPAAAANPSAPNGQGVGRMGASFAPQDPAAMAKQGQQQRVQEVPASAPAITTQ
jgi:general secretion pathway protein C